MNRGIQTALLTATAIFAAGTVGWWLLRLYSVPRPYDAFVPPTRDFLQAGLALDSVRLVRLASAESPVRWALQTGRTHPVMLRDLLHDLHAVGGRRIGEATSVIFAGWNRGSCRNHLLSVSFEGQPEGPLIRDISSDCRPPR